MLIQSRMHGECSEVATKGNIYHGGMETRREEKDSSRLETNLLAVQINGSFHRNEDHTGRGECLGVLRSDQTASAGVNAKQPNVIRFLIGGKQPASAWIDGEIAGRFAAAGNALY